MKFEKILNNMKNIDKKTHQIMKNGMKFSIIFCLFSNLILATYCTNYNPIVYTIGISMFKSGLFFLTAFIICGFAFNNIIKEINKEP